MMHPVDFTLVEHQRRKSRANWLDLTIGFLFILTLAGIAYAVFLIFRG